MYIRIGLAFLHTSGIIHGDVRTGNILVKDNGEAAICDFGHSRKFFKEHDSDQKVKKKLPAYLTFTCHDMSISI